MPGDANPARMSLVGGLETMLLGFASGALTGAACLAVVKRQFGRRDREDDGLMSPTEAPAVGSSDGEQPAAATVLQTRPKPRQKESNLGYTVAVFLGGPLQHATELLHEIKEARAAASTSVAGFKHLVSSQGLFNEGSAPDLLLASQLAPLGAVLSQLDEHNMVHPPVNTHSRDLESAADQRGPADTAHKRGQQQSQEVIPISQFLEQQSLVLDLQQQLQVSQQHALMAQHDLSLTSAELSAARTKLLQLQSCRVDLQEDVSNLMTGLTILVQQLHMTGQQQCVARGHLSELQQGVILAKQQLQHGSGEPSAGCSRLQEAEKPGDMRPAPAQAVASTKEQLQQTVSVQQQMQAALSAACALNEDSWDNLLQIDQLLQNHQVQATAAMQVQQQDKRLPPQAAAAGQAIHAHSLLEQTADQACQQAEQHLNQAGASSEQLQELQAQLATARAAAVSFQQQLVAAHTAHETQQESLELRSQEQEQQLEALQAELEGTTAQLAEAEQQVQGLQYTANTRLEMLETLEAQLAAAQQAASAEDTQQDLSSAAEPATLKTATGAGSVPFGSVGDKTPRCQDTTVNMTRQVGSPSVVPLAAAVLQAFSGAGDAENHLAEHKPPSSLLEELRHESDELSEQLAQLQQYLKASSARFGHLDSLEAMDAGLHVLQRVAGDTVKVAASTVERVCEAASVRSAPTSVGGAPALTRGVAVTDELPAKQVSCAGVVEGSPPAAYPCTAHAKSVAMRRLGLELPRLQPWASPAEGPDPDIWQVDNVSAAAAQVTPKAEDGSHKGFTPGSCATPVSPGPGSALACCEVEGLEWHLDVPETACSWLRGDLQLEQELSALYSPRTQPELALTDSTTSNAPMLQLHAHSSSLVHRSRSSTVGSREPMGELMKWGSGAMRVSQVGLGSQDMPSRQQPGDKQHQRRVGPTSSAARQVHDDPT